MCDDEMDEFLSDRPISLGKQKNFNLNQDSISHDGISGKNPIKLLEFRLLSMTGVENLPHDAVSHGVCSLRMNIQCYFFLNSMSMLQPFGDIWPNWCIVARRLQWLQSTLEVVVIFFILSKSL